MTEHIFKVAVYQDCMKDRWDAFVLGDGSVMGTFLQTRQFLEYHPKNRFVDCSLMVYDEKDNLMAVVPACVIENNGVKTLYSHKGSTYGGICVLSKRYTAEYLHQILKAVETYCYENGIDRVKFKITPSVYCKTDIALMQYILQYNGYTAMSELSTFIDFSDYGENTLQVFEQGKRTNVTNCIKSGLKFRQIFEDADIKTFYGLLEQNLAKHNTKPIHSLDELLEFKNVRLKEKIEFVGVFDGTEMVAGGMNFIFDNVKMMHTQYLCANLQMNKLSPMTFLYYSIIENARSRNFKGLSFGTSTEENGKVLNFGLIRSKEAYGSKHYLNWTYEKELTK